MCASRAPEVELEDGAPDTACVWCGYDLRGLTLPRPCPECGTHQDAGHHERVVAWYVSPEGLLLREPPPAFARAVGDPRCTRVARRRAWLGVLLPCVLSVALIVAANAVVVSETTPEWWERPGNPGQRLDERTLLREVRLLTMSDFDLFQEIEESSGSPFWTLFITAERRSEAPTRAIQLSAPRPDGLTALLIVVPAGVAFVSLLAAAGLRCLAGSFSRRNSGAFMTAVAAFAPWASLLCGIVLLAGFLCCLGGLRHWRGADVVTAALALGCAAAFVLVGGHSVVAYIRGSGPRLRRAGFVRSELMPILGWWLLCGLVAAGGMMLVRLAG